MSFAIENQLLALDNSSTLPLIYAVDMDMASLYGTDEAISQTVKARVQTLVHAVNTKDFALYESILSPSTLAEFSFHRCQNLTREDCFAYMQTASSMYPSYFVHLREFDSRVHRNERGNPCEVEVYATGEHHGIASEEIVLKAVWTFRFVRWKGEWVAKNQVVFMGPEL